MPISRQQTGYVDPCAFGTIGVGIFDEDESLNSWSAKRNRSATDAVGMVDLEWGSSLNRITGMRTRLKKREKTF